MYLELLRMYLGITQELLRNCLECTQETLRIYLELLSSLRKLLRNHLGITQESLRNYLGITQSTQELTLSAVFTGITQTTYFHDDHSICHTAIYWLVAHFMVLLLMYHHRLPSPAPSLESHDAPEKSLVCLRMENRMVPVSPTGTRASLPKIKVMGTTYRT